MVLSLLPDRSTEREREGQAGREGGERVTEGVPYKKEGCSTQKHKVLGLEGVSVWVWRGMGIGSALQLSVLSFKPQHNPANLTHCDLKTWGIFFF